MSLQHKRKLERRRRIRRAQNVLKKIRVQRLMTRVFSQFSAENMWPDEPRGGFLVPEETMKRMITRLTRRVYGSRRKNE